MKVAGDIVSGHAVYILRTRGDGAVAYVGQGRDHAVRIGQHDEAWVGAVDPAQTAVFACPDGKAARRWEDLFIKLLAPRFNRARGIGVPAPRHQYPAIFPWDMHLPDADARRTLKSYLGVRVGEDGSGTEDLCRHIIDRLAAAGAAIGDVGCGDAGIPRFAHHPYHPAFKLRYPVRRQYLMSYRPGSKEGWGMPHSIPDGGDLARATLSFWWQDRDEAAEAVRCQIDALLARAGIDYQNPQPTPERTDPIVPGPNGETLADIRAMLKGKGIDYPLHPDETVAGGDEQDSGSPIDASPPSGNGGT